MLKGASHWLCETGQTEGQFKVQALAYSSDTIWLLLSLSFSLDPFHFLGGRVQNSDKMMDALWFKQSVLPRAVLWKTFCETWKKQTAPKQAHSSLIHSLGKLSPKVSKYNCTNAVLEL